MGNVGSPVAVDTVTRVWLWQEEEEEEVVDEERGERAFRLSLPALALPASRRTLLVLLRHHESGLRKIYVNGKLVHEGHTTFDSVDVAFDAPPAGVGRKPISSFLLRIYFNSSWTDHSWTYRYELFAFPAALPAAETTGGDGAKTKPKGQLLTELNDITSPDVAARDPNELNVSVGTTQVDEANKVVLYQVRCIVKGEQNQRPQEFVTEHRFKDFDTLHSDVWSCFVGTHMLSSLPSLPSKYLKVLSNHLDPDFIEERRRGLDSYLKKLVRLPRMGINQYLRIFLGITPPFSDDTSGIKSSRIILPVTPAQGQTQIQTKEADPNPFVNAAAAAATATTTATTKVSLSLNETVATTNEEETDVIDPLTKHLVTSDSSAESEDARDPIAPRQISSQTKTKSSTAMAMSSVSLTCGKAKSVLPPLHLFQQAASHPITFSDVAPLLLRGAGIPSRRLEHKAELPFTVYYQSKKTFPTNIGVPAFVHRETSTHFSVGPIFTIYRGNIF